MTHEEVEILYVEDNAADVELTMIALRRKQSSKPGAHRPWTAREALDFLFCRGPHAGRPFHAPQISPARYEIAPRSMASNCCTPIRADQRTAMIPVVVLTSSDEQKRP